MSKYNLLFFSCKTKQSHFFCQQVKLTSGIHCIKILRPIASSSAHILGHVECQQKRFKVSKGQEGAGGWGEADRWGPAKSWQLHRTSGHLVACRRHRATEASPHQEPACHRANHHPKDERTSKLADGCRKGAFPFKQSLELVSWRHLPSSVAKEVHAKAADPIPSGFASAEVTRPLPPQPSHSQHPWLGHGYEPVRLV